MVSAFNIENEIDHSSKYKVFELLNNLEENRVVCRISGMGHELPHNRLRYLKVGQSYRLKHVKYVRVL